MLSRRNLLAAGAAVPLRASGGAMFLCMHQTTSAAAGFRASLEGYARAGIRYVELTASVLEEFVRREGTPAARRLLADLGLEPVSLGSVAHLAEPNAARAKALDDLKSRAALAAELAIDRLVCPCAATEKFGADDYQRGRDNLREAGEIVRPLGITAMLEFTRGSTFIGTLPTALQMTRGAAHSFVRPMLDCYHFWAGLSKFEDLDLIGDGEIHHVHFQDTPDMPREQLDHTTREIPGEGVAPLVRILRKLGEKRYRGPLSVELFYPRYQTADPYEVALNIRRKAEQVLRAAGVS